jgi:hypothetical protein
MTAAARFKSAYDLEDACFKLYSEAMKQPDVVSSDILTVQHERSQQDALDAFDNHPQIKKFKTKLVNAARTSLIQVCYNKDFCFLLQLLVVLNKKL